ncbi:MAG TPA: hypothetical protein P5564_07115, partial [Paludibacteraceae bacterium]|nr:hypothetical protein [Paludibacteraceae bacterium]
MATITITRGLPSVFSVYNIITIEFTIDTGVVPSVQIANNGTTYTFTPVRTALNQGGLDKYIFDASEVVKSFMGLPPINTELLELLTKRIIINIVATGATTAATSGYCSYGYSSVGYEGFSYILSTGTLDVIYRYSNRLVFYKKATTEGVLTVKVGDVVSTYGASDFIWNQGVTRLALKPTQNISGTVIIDFEGTSQQSFEQVKLPIKSGYVPVMWINRSGLWAEVYMRELSRTRINKQSNTIPINNTLHENVIALNREISADKKVSVTLDCIAYNEDHYKQLTEIQDSLSVLFESKKVRVAKISNKVAACKQN